MPVTSVSPRPSLWPAFRRWTLGLAVGFVGGIAILIAGPLMAVGVFLSWTAFGLLEPRFAALAGSWIGHGVVWLLVLPTSTIGCLLAGTSPCSWSMEIGPLQIHAAGAWQAGLDAGFGLPLALFIVGAATLVGGVLVMAWTAHRGRQISQ